MRIIAIIVCIFAIVSIGIGQESGKVIITEIMYNPKSTETTEMTQYIEIGNTTPDPISLINWTIDDEDTDGPNILPDITLPPYGILVICECTESDFTGAWGTGITVISLTDIGQSMFNLGNSPSSTDEIIQLRDDLGNLVDEVNYDDSGAWPSDASQVAIYLNLPNENMNAASNNDGSNWANSSGGVDGAYNSQIFGVWNQIETGSPGNIMGDLSLPVELSSFTAYSGDGNITLRWTTQSEVDNQGYIILRSENKDDDYLEVDSYVYNETLNGAGNTSESTKYVYIDRFLLNDNTYWYKLVDVDINGIRTDHGPISATPHQSVLMSGTGNVPQSFALHRNYPNPFNPSTRISFDIPSDKGGSVNAEIAVFDVLGRKIKTIISDSFAPGTYEIEWDGKNEQAIPMSSGMYFLTLKSDTYVSTRKMILSR
ncbi:MAG: lamin tail domain-containing protein [Calditrichaceae bacterium]